MKSAARAALRMTGGNKEPGKGGNREDNDFEIERQRGNYKTVILSDAGGSRSELPAESKDPGEA